MKVLRGVAKIGEYLKIPVTIDWDYVTQEFGNRKESALFDKALAYLLKIIALIILVIGLITAIKSDILNWQSLLNVNNQLGLMFWAAWIIFFYSLYLGRNRKLYDDNIEISSLLDFQDRIKTKRKIKAIELEDYLSQSLLIMIDEAIESGDEHFLGFILEYLIKQPEIVPLLKRMGLKKGVIEQLSSRLALEPNTHIDNWFEGFLLGSLDIAMNLQQDQVDLVAAFIYLAANPLKNVLLNYDVQGPQVKALEGWVKTNNLKNKYQEEFSLKSPLKPKSTVNRSYTSSFSPTLYQFSRDFTAEVAKSDFILSIGREKELEKLIELVQQGDTSATLIVGAPGVGKTTFIKSFAVRMVSENVPDSLKDMRLVSFEFNRAFALSKDVDEFKGKVEKVLEEVATAGNIILLIEDFDQLVGVRAEFAAEIINLMIKAMETYQVRIIASTNPEGYIKSIRSRESLITLFSVMNLEEPSDDIAVQILLDELPKLEKKYKLRVEFDALPRVVHLSHQYDFERVLPDKALQLLEEACSSALHNNLSFVDEKQIEDIVSAKVGVNVGKVSAKESQLLLKLEDKIHQRLIGQVEAVKAVAAALRRARAGLTKQNRPIASFLFFGPTGVGKTELAKALASEYYGDEKLMIRLDMSEYQEAENLKRLIGEARGDEFVGGYLTEAVRNKPYSLILLDEVEKANIRVLDLFLQVLDEGHLTDGLGRKVSFANTIIIMTSNACSGQIADAISAGKKYLDVYRELQPQLRQVFRVEFLNRFDKVIMFKPLMPVEMLQVVNLLMNKVHDVLADKGIELKWQPQVLQEIIETGYDKVYGARELRRVIQDYVEDKIAQLIIDGRAKSGSIITINNLSEFVIE